MALILEVCQPILWCTISLKKREKKRFWDGKKTTMPNFCWIPFCFTLKPRSSKPLTCRWLLLMMPLPSFPSPVLRSINTSTGGCGATDLPLWESKSTWQLIVPSPGFRGVIPMTFFGRTSYDLLVKSHVLPVFVGNHSGNCSQKKTPGSAHEAHPILQLVIFIRRMRTQCINGTTPGWSSYNPPGFINHLLPDFVQKIRYVVVKPMDSTVDVPWKINHHCCA